MTGVWKLLQRGEVLGHLVLSVGLVAFVLLVRWALLRFVRATHMSGERTALRVTVQIKRSAVVLVLLALGLIWASELRTFALSVTAIAVALVIATKEMLLCAMGALLRASSGSFHIGDRIEVGDIRGDVVDHGLLATTLHEVGPGHQWTGRMLTLPNSVLLTETVINESILRKYVLHVITVPIPWDAEWRDAEAALIDAADEICADYLEEARHELGTQARNQGLDPPWVEPRVNVDVVEAGKLQLSLRLPTASRDKGVIEQQVLRRFLDALKERDIGAESSQSLPARG
jgi:small-conductance mechanosensitive channel